MHEDWDQEPDGIWHIICEQDMLDLINYQVVKVHVEFWYQDIFKLFMSYVVLFGDEL